MLAINHAQLAVTIALGGALVYNQPFYLPLIMFVIFAGVLPDIDHPGSELGRFFKPIGMVLPHRGVTHSILGSAIVISTLYYTLQFNRVLSTIFFIGAIFGWNLCKKIFAQHLLSLDEKTHNLVSRRQTEIALGMFNFIINFLLLIILFLLWKQQYGQQIFYLISLGYIAHLVGDFVTIEGIPLFWPIKKKFGLRMFRTGGAIEGLIGFCLFFVNIYLVYKYGLQYNVWTPEYWFSSLLS
jgi:membrane-bound metal-dependent hydrolase YbcI (DUF457 family)